MIEIQPFGRIPKGNCNDNTSDGDEGNEYRVLNLKASLNNTTRAQYGDCIQCVYSPSLFMRVIIEIVEEFVAANIDQYLQKAFKTALLKYSDIMVILKIMVHDILYLQRAVPRALSDSF